MAPRKRKAMTIEPFADAIEHLEAIRHLIQAISREQRLLRDANGSGNAYRRNMEPAEARVAAIDAHLAVESARAMLEAREDANQRLGPTLPIDELCKRLNLAPFERWVLLFAAVAALDLTAEDDFGELTESAGNSLTVLGVFILLELSLRDQLAHRAYFRADAPLRRGDLITLGLGRRATAPSDLLRADIHLTPQSLALLLGDDSLSDELVELSSIEDPLATFESVVLPHEERERILNLVDGHTFWPPVRAAWGLDRTIRYGRGSFLLFSGPPGTGKTMTAHAIAHRLQKRILSVDIPTLVDHVDNMRLLPGLFREARLRDAILFFDECETFFQSRQRGNTLMPMLLTELERYDGIAVFATNLPESLDEAIFRRFLLHVRFEAPDAAARLNIWRTHLPSEAPLADDVQLHDLAHRFALTGGEVKNAVSIAFASAFAQRGKAGPIFHDDLSRAARDQLRPNPSAEEDAADLRWSDVRMRDVFLPADLRAEIDDFTAVAREVKLVQQEWGVAHRDGLAQVVLLHGEPGTGKTLCARAIAGELGRPLLRVSVGGLRSKWVGESESRLTRVFARAAREGAVVLLDEVDAIVAPRGDARTARHEDVLTSTLLVLLDAHDGVVVMTTNRPQCVDSALARRIGWHLEVPLPDAAARASIWRAMLPETAPLHPQLDLNRLARRHALSGGDIRTVAVRAAARAASRGQTIDERMLDELATTLTTLETHPRSVRAGRGVA